MKSLVQEIRLSSWEEFKTKVDSFPLQYVFRGEACGDFLLSSSLERSNLLANDSDIETRLINEYRKASSQILEANGIPTNTLDWLATLQHHGTPTRLIDFTESPYVAAFFAFWKPCKSERVGIWCLNRIRFFQGAIYYLNRKGFEIYPGKRPSYLFTSEDFERLFSQSDYDCVMPFGATSPHQRYWLQQSLFLSATNLNKPLMDQLGFMDYQDDCRLIKVTLPCELRNQVLRDLMKMILRRFQWNGIVEWRWYRVRGR